VVSLQVKANEPKLLRVNRAAHELGLHPFTVRKWIKAGKIQAIRVGNEARVPRSEIERLAGKTVRAGALFHSIQLMG
jgi:putative resolvase